jgi:hypothetical protein
LLGRCLGGPGQGEFVADLEQHALDAVELAPLVADVGTDEECGSRPEGEDPAEAAGDEDRDLLGEVARVGRLLVGHDQRDRSGGHEAEAEDAVPLGPYPGQKVHVDCTPWRRKLAEPASTRAPPAASTTKIQRTALRTGAAVGTETI